jgi:hypothetical protein|tara:strand:+ start:3477 stop:3782 length:306 start_codon:yes stop_codon:yes gene_type:complete
MAKGLQSWSVKEAGAPITSAESKTATSATVVSFSQSTRAMMGVSVPTNAHDMTITLASGETIVIPGAAVSAIFAPGAIVPFACNSFSFASTETGFRVIGLF